METFFFVFSMLLILACMLAASVSVCAYLVTRRPSFIAMTLAFSAYLIESSLVVYEEYVPGSVLNTGFVSEPGAIENMGIKYVTSALLIFSVWYLVCRAFSQKWSSRLLAIPLAVSILQATSAVVKLSFDSGHICFYLIRDLYFIACCIALCALAARMGSEGFQESLGKAVYIIVVCFVLMVAALFVDMTALNPLYEVLWPETMTGVYAELYFYIVRRNIFEIAAVLLWVVLAIRYGGGILALRFSSARSVSDSDITANELRLNRFATRYNLSERENEVFIYLLSGASYQQIANALFISPGTVKAHASHIYAKTNTRGRDELVRAFWQD